MKLKCKMSFLSAILLMMIRCVGNCVINVLFAFTHTSMKLKKTFVLRNTIEIQ